MNREPHDDEEMQKSEPSYIGQDSVEGRIDVDIQLVLSHPDNEQRTAHYGQCWGTTVEIDITEWDPDFVVGAPSGERSPSQPDGYDRPYPIESLFGWIEMLADQAIEDALQRAADDLGTEPGTIPVDRVESMYIALAPELAEIVPPHEFEIIKNEGAGEETIIMITENGPEAIKAEQGRDEDGDE